MKTSVSAAIVATLIGLGRGDEIKADEPVQSKQGQGDQQFFETLVAAGGGLIARRSTPYRLFRAVRLHSGCSLRFEAGTRIQFDPAGSEPGAVGGVFWATGSNITIEGVSGNLEIEAATPSRNLYAVLVTGGDTVAIRNVASINCSHVYCAGSIGSYNATLMSGAGANVSRNISVTGGGARFDTLETHPGRAACVVSYTDHFVVTGCSYVNVPHGVQWWGGDANPNADGAALNERKCRNGRITRVRVRNAQGASIWGSMGANIIVEDCYGINAGDVGFDAEGSRAITFVRCTQTRAEKGCFATFFLNEEIVFQDCVGTQENADAPMFRMFSEVPGNGAVSILGGRFTCGSATPGVIDDAFGDARRFVIRGAQMNNVVVKLHYRDHHQLIVEDNVIALSRRAGGEIDGLLLGQPVPAKGSRGQLIVTGNHISTDVPQPGNSRGIHVATAPPDREPGMRVSGNVVRGFGIPVQLPDRL